MSFTSKQARALASRIAQLSRLRSARAPAGLDRADPTMAQEKLLQRALGRYEVATGSGPTSAALAAQVRLGRLTAAQAAEVQAHARPSARFADRRFGDQAARMVQAELAERAASPRAEGLVDAQLQARPAAGAAIHIERLPETYDRDLVGRVIRQVAEEVAVAAPAPQVAHTVDGAVLAPGSVPVEAIDQRALGRELLALPSASEAVELEFVHSTTMDRFVRKAATGDAGPGRIWEARELSGGPASRVGAGPTRYRVVKPDMRFGVMSMRLATDANLIANSLPGFFISYGAVITKIPHFLGRAPERILSAEAVGNQPMSFAFRTNDGGKIAAFTAPRDFYWARTKDEYETQGLYPFLATVGTDTVLRAVSASWRENAGLVFQLITGRDANEVFQQLCTRNVLGKMLCTNAVPPSVSLPAACPVESATPPNCVIWDSATFPAVYLHRTQTSDLTALGIDERLVQGLPFDYDDCAALVPTDTHFSLVVQWGFEKAVAQAPTPAAYGTPETWHQNGIRTVERTSGRLRNWAVDIIVS